MSLECDLRDAKSLHNSVKTVIEERMPNTFWLLVVWVGYKKILCYHTTDWGRLMCNAHYVTQFGNFVMVLSLRIYVKLILEILEVQNLPF